MMKNKKRAKKMILIILGVIAAIILTVVLAGPSVMHTLGLHPDYDGPTYKVEGKRALIVTTSHSVLSKPGETEGKATGVYITELTHPYYVFLDAGMEVDVASIQGGDIPIDPSGQTFLSATDEDKRFEKDDVALAKVENGFVN